MEILKTVRPVKAKNPYKPYYGDLVCEFFNEGMGEFFEVSPKKPLKEYKDWQVLPLRILNPNPWVALTELAIESKEIQAPYNCPYTNYVSQSVVPTALISTNLKGKYGYINHWNKDYIFDYEFHKDNFRDNLFELGVFGELFLGSGYTDCTGVNDGSRSKFKSTVQLENGDKLFVHFWMWYNK